MHSFDRTLASYFTLAVQLRPESTAIAATGLVAPDPFDDTGQWARTEKGALDICARDLERQAADGGWWTILSHPSYTRSVLLESVVPNAYPDVDPLEQLPNAHLWPAGVIEHDSEFGSRYWVYTGPDLEEGGWVATDAADRFFQERWSILTSTGWESNDHLSGPPDTADQQTWGGAVVHRRQRRGRPGCRQRLALRLGRRRGRLGAAARRQVRFSVVAVDERVGRRATRLRRR
jgi:hypothetical protein